MYVYFTLKLEINKSCPYPNSIIFFILNFEAIFTFILERGGSLTGTSYLEATFHTIMPLSVST